MKTFSLPSGNYQTAGRECLRFSGSSNLMGKREKHSQKQFKDKRLGKASHELKTEGLWDLSVQ